MANPLAYLPDAELYERDFYAWTERQTAALQARRLHELDLDNLAEELADLRASITRELRSRLDLLLGHLLKLATSADHYPRRKWWATVTEQQRRIGELLDDNPSLRREFPDLYQREWLSGLTHARVGLRDEEADRIPDLPPWFTFEQAMSVNSEADLQPLRPPTPMV